MKKRLVAAILLAAFLPATVPTRALAQEDPVTTAARARFKEGVDFYDKGKFEEARLAFLQAYALKKHPAVLLNLAQSTLKAGHNLEAAKYFQQFLREAQNVTPAQKKDAETGLSEARQKLGRVEIIAAPGTEITLDDKEKIGNAPFAEWVDVEPGPHTFRSPTEAVKVNAVAGQKTEARFGGVAAPPPVVVVPVGPAPTTNQEPPVVGNNANNVVVGGDRSRRTDLLSPPENMVPVYIGLGFATVGLLGAVVFAAFKSDAQTKADSVANEIRQSAATDPNVTKGPNAPGVCAQARVADRYGDACQTLLDNNNKVDTNATIANVSLGVMGASLLFSAIWYLAAPKKKGAAANVTGATTLTPYGGYGNSGFLFSGSF